MTQAYSDPARESDPYSLPNVEVFRQPEGWFYWFCFPGCLPDSDMIGPFDSAEEALADAQDDNYSDDE